MRAYPTSDIKLRQTPPTVLNSTHCLIFPSSMAPTLISATSSSSTSSFGCIDNFPRPPTSIPTKSSSTVFNSTAHLVHMPPSYPPMPRTNTDHQYIPFDPLNPPCRRPSLPYQLGEDISGTGMGTCYIGIVERSPGLLRITIRQDGMSNHYTQQVPQGDIIDPEKRDVCLRCMRVRRAVKLLWQELRQLLKSCTPQ